MLHQDGPERLAALRDVIARIEASPGLSRTQSPRRYKASHKPFMRLGRGDLKLDAMLGGGLRRRSLHEIVAVHRQDDGAAAGFAATLALRCAGQGSLVWILEDCAAFETGSPYSPGLAGYGLDPARFILVRTRDAAMTLWAIEEALRLKATAVLAELWSSRHYGLAPSRRLLLAARAGGGTALLLHTGLSGRGSVLSSAAETRFAVAACPSPRLESAGHRLPIPGPPAFAVRLVKQRLSAVQGFDGDHLHGLVWNAEHRCFDDHPIPFDPSAMPADGPSQTSKASLHQIVRHA